MNEDVCIQSAVRFYKLTLDWKVWNHWSTKNGWRNRYGKNLFGGSLETVQTTARTAENCVGEGTVEVNRGPSWLCWKSRKETRPGITSWQLNPRDWKWFETTLALGGHKIASCGDERQQRWRKYCWPCLFYRKALFRLQITNFDGIPVLCKDLAELSRRRYDCKKGVDMKFVSKAQRDCS